MSTFSYDGSFNGASFFELFDSNFSATESGQASATKVHYTSGGNGIKDSGNEKAEITVGFAADTSDYNTLKSKLGTGGTLVARGGDVNTGAFLYSYSAQKLKIFDIYKGTLVFWTT